MTKITEEQLGNEGFEFYESEFLGGCTLEGDELEDHECDDWKCAKWETPDANTKTLTRTCRECCQIERMIYLREQHR